MDQYSYIDQDIMDPQISMLNDDISQLRQVAGSMEEKLQKMWSEKIKNIQTQKQSQQNDQKSSQYLSQQNEILKNQLKQQNEENQIIIESLKKSINNQQKNYSYEGARYQQENQELKAQFVLIRAENDRLVKCLFEKVQSFQQKHKDLKMVFSNVASETQEQLDNLSNKYREDAQLMQSHVKDIHKKHQQTKQSLDESIYENSRLKRQLENSKEYTHELGDLEERYEQLQQQHEKLIFDYQNSQKLQQDFKVFNAQRSEVESDMFKLKNKLIECEEYISSLKTDNEKLHQLSVQRLREIETWKNKCMIQGVNQSNEVKQQLEKMNVENLEQKEIILKVTGEKNKLESIRKQLVLEIQQKNDDLERTHKNLQQNKDQAEKLYQQVIDLFIFNINNEDYRKEILNLKKNMNVNQDLIHENETLKSKLQELGKRLQTSSQYQ